MQAEAAGLKEERSRGQRQLRLKEDEANGFKRQLQESQQLRSKDGEAHAAAAQGALSLAPTHTLISGPSTTSGKPCSCVCVMVSPKPCATNSWMPRKS